jgi:Protein of unknown function (DUF2794)
LSESEPIALLRPRRAAPAPSPSMTSVPGPEPAAPARATFNRLELTQILDLYGRKVACGEWRDYAIDLGRDIAAFSVFRRTSECPLYRIEKTPKLARRQGAYAVVAASGHILKRGSDLRRVLAVLDKSLMRLVD